MPPSWQEAQHAPMDGSGVRPRPLLNSVACSCEQAPFVGDGRRTAALA